MKMKILTKKALTSGLLVKAVIAIVVLLMLSMIFFVGDNSQFGQIKNLFPTMTSQIQTDQYSTPDYEFASAEEKSTLVFQELVKGIKILEEEVPSYKNCFYFLPSPLPYDALDELWIRIQKTQSDGTVIFLETPVAKAENAIKGENQYSQTGAMKSYAAINSNICVILDDSAKNFADAVKKRTKDAKFLPTTGTYEDIEQLILTQKYSYMDGYQIISFLKTNDYHLGLAKISSDKICLLLTERESVFGGIRDVFTANDCQKVAFSQRGVGQKVVALVGIPAQISVAVASLGATVKPSLSLYSKLDARGGNFLGVDCLRNKRIKAYQEHFSVWTDEFQGCYTTQEVEQERATQAAIQDETGEIN